MLCVRGAGGHLCLCFLAILKDLLDLPELREGVEGLLVESGSRARALSNPICLITLTRSGS